MSGRSRDGQRGRTYYGSSLLGPILIMVASRGAQRALKLHAVKGHGPRTPRKQQLVQRTGGYAIRCSWVRSGDPAPGRSQQQKRSLCPLSTPSRAFASAGSAGLCALQREMTIERINGTRERARATDLQGAIMQGERRKPTIARPQSISGARARSMDCMVLGLVKSSSAGVSIHGHVSQTVRAANLARGEATE